MIQLNDEKFNQLKEFKNCFVEQPIVTEIFNDFERLRFNQKLGGNQQCMLVTGDTGVGKTELTKWYLRQSPQTRKGGYLHRPVLLSRIPSNASLDSTLIELHKDLGQPFSVSRRGKSNDQALTESLVRLLLKCGTELIIIDEFQELLEFQSVACRSGIANRLKFISEKTEIPIVLVGMPWAEKIADEPQWGQRLLNRRVIPYFKLSENPQDFVQFLKGFAQQMPFSLQPKLEEKHTTYALFASSRGQTRFIKEFLYEAVKLALLEDAITLTTEHMAQIFSLWSPSKPNPFEQKVDEIVSTEVSEYSTYDFDASKDVDPIRQTTFIDQLPISQLLSKSRMRKQRQP